MIHILFRNKMTFWRAAGLTYVNYSNIAATCVRNALRKELKVVFTFFIRMATWQPCSLHAVGRPSNFSLADILVRVVPDIRLAGYLAFFDIRTTGYPVKLLSK